MKNIEFRREFHDSSFLDPRKNYTPKTVTSELRFDPLTGRISRVFPFRRLIHQRHDWTPFVEQSRQQFCPFCPENLDKSTPKFLPEFSPEGHIRVGDATAIPNLHPYDKYTAVVVMCREHYVPMGEIKPPMIIESFKASLEFLQRAQQVDPQGAKYCSINWNYMPYAGGSIIHPHLQVLAGPTPPTYEEVIYREAAKYFKATGQNFFLDLVAAEQDRGERYLGQKGQIHWLSTFAPRHVADVTGILPGKVTIWDVQEEDLKQLAESIACITRYYDSVNLPSFNAAVYFGPEKDPGFCINIRAVGRFTIFPLVGSDITHMQVLHDDPWTVLPPEKLAEDLKPYLGGD